MLDPFSRKLANAPIEDEEIGVSGREGCGKSSRVEQKQSADPA